MYDLELEDSISPKIQELIQTIDLVSKYKDSLLLHEIKQFVIEFAKDELNVGNEDDLLDIIDIVVKMSNESDSFIRVYPESNLLLFILDSKAILFDFDLFVSKKIELNNEFKDIYISSNIIAIVLQDKILFYTKNVTSIPFAVFDINYQGQLIIKNYDDYFLFYSAGMKHAIITNPFTNEVFDLKFPFFLRKFINDISFVITKHNSIIDIVTTALAFKRVSSFRYLIKLKNGQKYYNRITRFLFKNMSLYGISIIEANDKKYLTYSDYIATIEYTDKYISEIPMIIAGNNKKDIDIICYLSVCNKLYVIAKNNSLNELVVLRIDSNNVISEVFIHDYDKVVSITTSKESIIILTDDHVYGIYDDDIKYSKVKGDPIKAAIRNNKALIFSVYNDTLNLTELLP